VDTPKDNLAETRSQVHQERKRVSRLFLLQVFLAAVMVTASCWVSKSAVVSVLVGSLIGLSTSVWMALVLLRPAASETPGKLLGALYIGELGKYLFVMAFFAIAFKKIVLVRDPHNALWMIGAFAITQLVIWLWPLLTVRVDGRTENKS
jgi:F0F1-type ATP synthase assembly protein I